MKTDPKIEVDYRTSKLIAQIICKEIEESFTKNSDYYQLANRCENQYNQITLWMENGQIPDEPWYGAADYFVPMTEWIIDAVHARIMNTLFSQEPYMEAHGVESSDISKEEGITDFVDVAFREIIHLYKNINFFMKQMIKIPMAIVKYDWAEEYDPMILRAEANKFVNPTTQEIEYVLPDDPEGDVKVAGFIANGWQEVGTEDVWVSDDVELINAPRLQYIKSRDYCFSPNAKRGTRLYWEGDRVWFTINEMQTNVNQGKFMKESVAKVRKAMGLNTQGKLAEQAIAARSKLRECFHWYGRLPFNKNNEIDFRDQESIEQEVHIIVDYKAKETLSLNHWEYSRKPHPERVYLHGMFEETEEYWGRSLSEKLYMSQKYLNQYYNTTMNNAMLQMQQIFVKKRSLQGEDWEKPEVYPGAMWEEDNTGDIRSLQMNDLKAISKDVEQSLLNFAERVSNISIYQTGTARQGGGKTKGEVDATIHEGNIGMDKLVKRCHDVLETIAKWTVEYYHERIPPGMERRIRGEQDEMIFPTNENMGIYQERGINPYWSQDDLAGQFDYKWKGTALNASKEWNLFVADGLMEKFLPQPMISGSLLATWEILKRGLKARNIKDWQTILPPKQAVLEEMEKMEKRANLRKMERTKERLRDLSIGGQPPAQEMLGAGAQQGRVDFAQ